MQAANRMDTAINGNRAAPLETLKPLVRQRAVLLTTYRRDGRPVGTPVHLAIEDDRAYFRTWDTTGKPKRIRGNAAVGVAPSRMGGTPTGAAIHARSRILAGDESAHAARALAHKYPILHGALIPLVHRLRHYRTIHIELTPTETAQRTH